MGLFLWRSIMSIAIVGGGALLAAPNPMQAMPNQASPAAFDAPVTLYNGTGSPNGQGFTYVTLPPGSQATQVGTNLNTMARNSDYAGFTANTMPLLDRQAGFNLRFSLRLNEENHADSDKNGDGIADRAGFSIILLASDKRGIELGFWPDRVWAQNDGVTEQPTKPQFTQGEGSAWSTTINTDYDLTIEGNSYTLRNGITTILSGPVRDYTSFSGTFAGVYRTPNLLFLGDDTTSARASTDFVGPIVISPLTASTGSKPTLYLPLMLKP